QKEPMRRKTSASQTTLPKLNTVVNKNIHAPIEISGHLYAYDKLEIYAEVSGVLLRTGKQFREGTAFRKGETLIMIDDRVYLNNVLAQKSSLLNQLTLLLPDLSIDFPASAKGWEKYLQQFQLDKPLALLPEPSNEKERYYIASRNIFNSFYIIKSMEATLAKYTINAPFSGLVTQSNINPGTLVRIGQKLGEFTNTELYELEAPVGLFDLSRIRVGQTVNLKTQDVNGDFKGRIQRINRVIDRNSMTVKVYIHLSDPLLKEGMYMTGHARGTPIAMAYTLAKDLLVDNDQIYVVKDNRLVLKKVEIVGKMGDRVIVRGLSDGTRILGETWIEAREGAQVSEK
ncbi:MAG: HlyD family efflux transporter periplasmic adaptor subunit, partial [Candidatus Aminicenantes bacterium]|nr:HlyD family efflux transporter periplasmic adaptor subunit [Candidatus Aminicenantes bacterium]